jgi:solute carrier family 6 GABA transporter-like protein 1
VVKFIDTSSQGNQLKRDLNLIVGQGKNWSIPVFWSPILRYVAAPALSIVYSFSYPNFYKLRNDPLHVLGFGVGHIGLLLVFGGFILPKWYDVFIPPSRRNEGKVLYGAGVDADVEEMERNAALEMAKKHNKDEDLVNSGALREDSDRSPSSSGQDKKFDANDDPLSEKAVR